jgi:hypothetical protein
MAEDALKNIHQLFNDCFIQNCILDDDEVNEIELETLQSLEPEEIFENLKELLTSLILFKKSVKNPDVKQLTQRLLVFEKMIQKLESDIRSHISVQHQMRLDMETYEFKIEELQKLKAMHVRKIEEMDKALIEKEAEILHVKNKNAVDLELKLKGIEDQFKHEICSAVDLYKKEPGKQYSERMVNERRFEKDKGKEMKVEQNFVYKDLQGVKGKKGKLPKVTRDGQTERHKRPRKSTHTGLELFKTIESIPRKEKKRESPYLRKDILHYRSSSDLGLTQKNALTIL